MSLDGVTWIPVEDYEIVPSFKSIPCPVPC
jgi:hypothetical protein